MTRLRAVVALALLVLGGASLGEAAYIRGKAWLGQRLIAHTWQQLQGGDEAARPWPWADTRPVARIEVPAHGVSLIVLAGGTGRTLAWGPGHLAGTAPVGASGNAVVGGHRDTHFAFLRDVEPGTLIRAQDVSGRRLDYRVVGSFVTHERDAEVLAPAGIARLTLVTCWPFDAALPGGTGRYVVVAEAASGDGYASRDLERRRAPERDTRRNRTPPAGQSSAVGSSRRRGTRTPPAGADPASV